MLFAVGGKCISNGEAHCWPTVTINMGLVPGGARGVQGLVQCPLPQMWSREEFCLLLIAYCLFLFIPIELLYL